MSLTKNHSNNKIGLILTGGGARAAYQVGVLDAISELLGYPVENPFPVLCGTSAGAINATALAAMADHFAQGVSHLVQTWEGFHAPNVYRCSPGAILLTGARWLSAMMLINRRNPVSLLDNSPLANLLEHCIAFDNIEKNVARGHLDALSVTASGYASGQSVTFYQSTESIQEWSRTQRVGCSMPIRVEHLMASSALPFLFPAVKLNREYFGDGSMRQVAPISPALHLGADRVLVIGTGRQTHDPARVRSNAYPSMAQIAGHALNSIFIDSLAQDIEWLQRINRAIALIPEGERARAGLPFRHVEVLSIAPSQSIERLAARHTQELPRAIRMLLRTSGAMNRQGSNLASYLLFEPGFCRALIDLGRGDTLARTAEVLDFLKPDH